MVGHLLALGHRRIGLVAGLPESFTGRERLAGYREALAEAGIAADPGLVQFGNFRSAEAVVATERLMALADPPTALVAANNLSAIGTMKGLSAAGPRLPARRLGGGDRRLPLGRRLRAEADRGGAAGRCLGAEAARMLVERMTGTAQGARADGGAERAAARAELDPRDR